jgi:hypothetical protein
VSQQTIENERVIFNRLLKPRDFSEMRCPKIGLAERERWRRR